MSSNKNQVSGSDDQGTSLHSLVGRYAGIVYWLAESVTGDSKEAEDVLHKTFAAVQSGFPGLRQNEPAVMRLARIAIDESFAKLRSQNMSVAAWLGREAEVNRLSVPQEVTDWRDDAENCLSRDEFRKIVLEAAQSLTPFSRTVFLLRDVANLKPEEIADLFCVPLPRVKANLLLGRLQLREHLNRYLKPNRKERVQTA